MKCKACRGSNTFELRLKEYCSSHSIMTRNMIPHPHRRVVSEVNVLLARRALHKRRVSNGRIPMACPTVEYPCTAPPRNISRISLQCPTTEYACLQRQTAKYPRIATVPNPKKYPCSPTVLNRRVCQCPDADFPSVPDLNVSLQCPKACIATAAQPHGFPPRPNPKSPACSAQPQNCAQPQSILPNPKYRRRFPTVPESVPAVPNLGVPLNI